MAALSPSHRPGCARLGIARLKAFRLDVYESLLRSAINGVALGAHPAGLRIEGASIEHVLNEQPDTAAFRTSASVQPVAGQIITVYDGDVSTSHQLFGGRILESTILYESAKQNTAYDIRCIDPTWLMNRTKVLATYVNQSATAIVLDLIARFCRGVTTRAVVAGLPTIDALTFTNEDLPQCLTTICERIGGSWYVDYQNDLHVFLTETEKAYDITDATPRTSRHHQLAEDLSQVVTRVIGRGGGGKAVVDVLAGATLLPVDESTWYTATGGSVECGAQVITYTGIAGSSESGTNIGRILAPPAPMLVTAGGGSGLPNGTYLVAFTWMTEAGETTIGPTASYTVTGAATNQIYVDNMPPPVDAAVTRIAVYLSDTNGAVGTLKKDSDWAYPYKTNLGPGAENDLILMSLASRTTPPPSVNTAGERTTPIAPGATSVPVEDTAPFPVPGWALAPGGQYISYTGKAPSTGVGSLTGLPASGTGAVTAPIKAGVVKVVPHLTGIPASGPGAIGLPIRTGDTVTIRIVVEDTAAQDTMADRLKLPGQSAVRADGIIETVVSDSRFDRIELTAQCTAHLTDRKNPQQTLTFESRDPSLEVGRLITINVSQPPIAGTFRIQRVSFSEIAIAGGRATVLPLRRVEASSKLFTFANLLRQLRGREGGVP